GCGVDADKAVLGDFAGLDPEFPAKLEHELPGALHFLDVIRDEKHAVAAGGAQMEKAVESRNAFDMGARELETSGDARQGARRQKGQLLLRLDENLQQPRGFGAMAR